MPLSSNSVIHFTQEKASIEGILRDNFHIKYCRETFDLGDNVMQMVVPMVSFCDIPLSEVKNHIESYGHYGIGLTKKWAVKNKLNPVLYIEAESTVAGSYLTLFDDVYAQSGKKLWGKTEKSILDILRYVKNYQRLLVRKDGTKIPNYRFSDEREWRYVPAYDAGCDMILSQAYYDKNKVKVDEKLKSMRLQFEPNDIKYIIIKSDGEISEFVELLRKAKSKYSYDDVERLTTRILTTEQIKEDI